MSRLGLQQGCGSVYSRPKFLFHYWLAIYEYRVAEHCIAAELSGCNGPLVEVNMDLQKTTVANESLGAATRLWQCIFQAKVPFSPHSKALTCLIDAALVKGNSYFCIDVSATWKENQFTNGSLERTASQGMFTLSKAPSRTHN